MLEKVHPSQYGKICSCFATLLGIALIIGLTERLEIKLVEINQISVIKNVVSKLIIYNFCPMKKMCQIFLKFCTTKVYHMTLRLLPPFATDTPTCSLIQYTLPDVESNEFTVLSHPLHTSPHTKVRIVCPKSAYILPIRFSIIYISSSTFEKPLPPSQVIIVQR